MQDLYCREIDDISNETLQKQVRFYKEGEGKPKMCELVREAFGEALAAKDAELERAKKQYQEQYREQYRKQYREQQRATFAASVQEGLSKGQIMKIMNLSEDQYNEFYQNLVCAEEG